jgi:hypothetical protein
MKRSIVFLLLLLPCGVAEGGNGNAGYAISRDQVCRSLDIDMNHCASAVEILGHPVALRSEVALSNVHATPSSLGQQITLRCADAACLPFVILLHRSLAAQPIVYSPKLRILPPLAVRAGEIAELVQTTDDIRLTRSVICMERGRVGDVIRVREPQKNQVMRAAVVGRGRLIAAF